MTFDTIPQTVLFPDLFDKPLVAEFDSQQTSSDGGAVLLEAAERVYGLIKAFARCLVDKRAPDKIRHTLEELIGQRVFGIACGHPDGNDGDRLADDPIHKLLLGRDRWRASAWRRSRPCRGSRTRWAETRSTGWGASWPGVSSSGIAAARTGRRGASRSIWTPPTTRRTAPAARRRTPPFWSTGRMRAFSGWRWHLDEVFVKINGKHAAGSAHYGTVVVPAHVAVAGGAITIRNLDDDVKTRLRTRAARHGRPVDRPSNTAGAVRPGMRRAARNVLVGHRAPGVWSYTRALYRPLTTPLVPLQSRHERGMRSHVGRASSSSVGSQHPRASRRP